MPFLLVIIGAILLITAVRNTHGDLGNALTQDAAGFVKWALAIVCIGALGWIPGMRPVSRMLLALVLVVIVLTNYRQAIAGVTNLQAPQAGATPAPTPSEAYVTNPNAAPTANQIAGVGGGGVSISTPVGPVGFDPSTFLAAINAVIGGVGHA